MSALKNLRWKVFLAAASDGRKRFPASDVEVMYSQLIDPLLIELEPYCEEIAEFCNSVPGFKWIWGKCFELSESNAQAVFKYEMTKTFQKKNEKTAKTDTDKKTSGFEHDILEHYFFSPPTDMGFPESFGDEEIVKKCFQQFKAILLFHSRALRLFDDVPFLFTTTQFTMAYLDKFEERINVEETGFESLQKLLEWLPEIEVENEAFKVSSSFHASKRVREVEDNYEVKVKKTKKRKGKRTIKKEVEDGDEAAKKKILKIVKEEPQDEHPPNHAASRRITRNQKEGVNVFKEAKEEETNVFKEIKKESDDTEPIGQPPMAHPVVAQPAFAPPPFDYQPNPLEEFEELIMAQNREIARELIPSPQQQHDVLIFGGQPHHLEDGFSAEELLREDENEPVHAMNEMDFDLD